MDLLTQDTETTTKPSGDLAHARPEYY